MFKEKSTEKLIEYIQTLPNQEQKLIIQGITPSQTINKIKKSKGIKKTKLSSLKGQVTKTSSAKIDNQIKSLRSEWKRSI
jgi:hypothetical protein